eukprot:scaffold249354_cov55-Cyclotella_meneghiniana.AAC.1
MSPTTRVLHSGRSYATVSPPRSRGPPLNRGRAPTISSSGPAGRGRSASSRGRGRGRSAPPSSAGKANRSRRARISSVARAPFNRRTTVAPSVPIIQPTPPMSNEAIRKAMASSMGPFDSDSDDGSLVDLAGAEDDGRDDGRDGLVFTPPPLLSANSLVCFRGFSDAPSKSQSYLFDKMTRSEKKNDPSFELIAMNNLDSHRLFDVANSRGFEFGNTFTRSSLIPGGGTGAFLHQPPSVITEFELGNYLDLQAPMSLLDEENSIKISFENVLKFTALVNGGDDALFETPVKGENSFYTLKSVDPNAPGRRGKLNRLKLDIRNASQAMLMLLKNNMKSDSWKALQLKCKPCRYKCEISHQVVECGEIWFKVLTMNTVPSTMMRGLHHKFKFDNYSFKDDTKWNPATYIAEQDMNQNKARICMGPEAITDQRYCEKMFLERP